MTAIPPENIDMETESADDTVAPADTEAAPPAEESETGGTADDGDQASPAQRRQEQLIARDSGLRLISSTRGGDPEERIFRQAANGSTEEMASPRRSATASLCAGVGRRKLHHRRSAHSSGTGETDCNRYTIPPKSDAPCSWQQKS